MQACAEDGFARQLGGAARLAQRLGGAQVGEPVESRTYPNDEPLWGRTSRKRFQLNYTGDEPIEGDRTTEPIPPSSVVDVRGEPERSDQ
jgi:hypothetical protein